MGFEQVFTLKFIFFLVLLHNGYAQSISQNVSNSDTLRIDSLRLLGLQLSKNYPDSAITVINEAIDLSEKLNDKVRVSKGYNVLGITYTSKSDLNLAFRNYKKALEQLGENQVYDITSAILNNQGNIYESLQLYDLAETFYRKSIGYLKRTDSPDRDNFLNNTLSNLGQIYRYKHDYGLAKEHYLQAIKVLESANFSKKEKVFRIARDSVQLGVIALELGNFNAAKKVFAKYTSCIEAYGYKINIVELYYYIGKLHLKTQEYNLAEKYLEKALELNTEINNTQLKVDLFSDLAKLYQIQDQSAKAIDYLNQRDVLKDSVYGVKNTWGIYELNQEFENTKQRQELELVKKEQKINQITKNIYIGGFILLLISTGIYTRFLIKKNQKQKQSADQELYKTKQEIDVKNKELTTSALQIIETDELMNYIKQNILSMRIDVDPKNHKKIEQIAASLDNTGKRNWEEFRLRFEQVNSDFYKKLKDSFPTLTSTELKLCSLLKLNFSSKEISVLMGISDKSVKMSRYRLRKKFTLQRKDNLLEFISRF